ncbi:uncharacterized protein WCC33_009958 [Rhinophrynus dorsalis]
MSVTLDHSAMSEIQDTPGLVSNLSSHNLYRTWTVAKIIKELQSRGIPYPATARKAELFKLLFSPTSTPRPSTSNSPAPSLSQSTSDLADLQASVATLAESVASIHARLDILGNSPSGHQVTQMVCPGISPNPVSATIGSPVPAISPAHFIPNHLKKDIIEGKDINLVSLLISSHDSVENKAFSCDQVSVVLKTKDPRLGKKLSVTEFVLAFSLYRDVICSVHPERREELDHYLYRVVELGHKYGGYSFYDYHKSFSAKAVAALAQFNITLDWSQLDMELFCRHFAGLRAPVCSRCQSTEHSTNLCPGLSNPPAFQPLPDTQGEGQSASPVAPRFDRLGRPIVFFGKSQICNNYNYTGCGFSACRLVHLCSLCKRAHPRSICPQRLFPKS